MTKIEELRKQIDEIDTQMIELFQKRMETVEQIAECKKDINMNTNDPDREKRIIESHLPDVKEKWKHYYECFQKELFRLSKEYQDELRK